MESLTEAYTYLMKTMSKPVKDIHEPNGIDTAANIDILIH